MKIICPNRHIIPEHSQIIAGACMHPECKEWYRFDLKGNFIDFERLKMTDIEIIYQIGFERGLRNQEKPHNLIDKVTLEMKSFRN